MSPSEVNIKRTMSLTLFGLHYLVATPVPVCTTNPQACTSTETCISPTSSSLKCRIGSRNYSSIMRLTYTLPARRPMEVIPDAASHSNPYSYFVATECGSPVISISPSPSLLHVIRQLLFDVSCHIPQCISL